MNACTDLENLIIDEVDESELIDTSIMERILYNVSNRQTMDLSKFKIKPELRFSYKLEFMNEELAKYAENELISFEPKFCEASFRLGSAIILHNVFNTNNETYFSNPYRCYSNQLSDFDKRFVFERINLN